MSKKQKKALKKFRFSANSALASSEEIAEAVRLAPYVEIIKKNLSIEPIRETRATIKDTRLIEISFRHTDPELAAFIVNGIGEVFTKAKSGKTHGNEQ